jgi:hypothetical protein
MPMRPTRRDRLTELLRLITGNLSTQDDSVTVTFTARRLATISYRLAPTPRVHRRIRTLRQYVTDREFVRFELSTQRDPD